MVNKTKLTKRTIDSLKTTEGRDRIRVYDTELRGFGITVYASGRKSFFIQYGPAKSRRRMKIGDYGPLTPDTAREMAQEALGSVAKGEDPIEAREAQKAIPTFKEWAGTYTQSVKRWKRSYRKDETFLAMASKRWGRKQLDAITVDDVRQMFDHLSTDGGEAGAGVPIRANRWLASVRACLQAAWRDGKIPDNPAMKVRPNPENDARDRVLSDDELKRLLEAVDTTEDVHIRTAFVLLIETGARLSEVLRAEWAHINLDERAWTLPSTHTKSKKRQTIPLTTEMVAHLRSLPRVGPFLIPGKEPDTHRYDLNKPWANLKKAANLDGVRIHDIRRTFGLHIARRAGLHIASRLLRHADIGVTQRAYTPFGLDELREAVEQRDAEIIPLKKKRGA
jgi:integrase